MKCWNHKTDLLECTIKHNTYDVSLCDVICSQRDYSEHDKVCETCVDSTIAHITHDNEERACRLSEPKRLRAHDIKL